MTAMLGELPTWKLEDLYSSPTGLDLDADLKRAAVYNLCRNYGYQTVGY